jgi:Domain of unknown function (DUF4126)
MDSTQVIALVSALLMGVGLSAAAGFRVFLPFLCLSAGSFFHVCPTPESMAWVGTLPALLLFGTAAVAEIGAYYIPWVDNILDTISTPAAAIAGTILTASTLSGHVDPTFQWVAGIMMGGSTAALISGGTAVTRAAASVTTGGIANPILSTTEIGGSLVISILAMLLPILAGCGVLILTFFTARFIYKKLKKDRDERTEQELIQNTEVHP